MKTNSHAICEQFQRGVCKSCTRMDVSYQAQLAHKNSFVHATLAQFLQQAQILEPVSSEPILGSRHKSKMAVGETDGALCIGFPKSDGTIINLPFCPILTKRIQNILDSLRILITEFALTPYSVAKNTGELKYIIIQESLYYHEVLVRLVLRSENELPRAEHIITKLCQQHHEIKVCSLNIQPKPAAQVEGEKEILLTTTASIKEKFNNLDLVIHPQAFTQVTPAVAEKLYASAAEWLPKNIGTVIDLYCGIGAFGLTIAKQRHETRVLGIEISTAAITSAQTAANLNQCHNHHSICKDATQGTQELTTERPDVIIVNPPRRGIGPALCETLLEVAPKHILYSSCNPESLAKDLTELTKLYSVERVQIFDMFPLTDHVETLVSCIRR